MWFIPLIVNAISSQMQKNEQGKQQGFARSQTSTPQTLSTIGNNNNSSPIFSALVNETSENKQPDFGTIGNEADAQLGGSDNNLFKNLTSSSSESSSGMGAQDWFSLGQKALGSMNNSTPVTVQQTAPTIMQLPTMQNQQIPKVDNSFLYKKKNNLFGYLAR